MRQASRFVQMLHCGGLLVLVMPIDVKAPGLLRCLECDRIDPSAVTTKEK
jgi:hypothetical protein